MSESSNITYKEIGIRIKDIRTYLLMTQQQVADAIGVSVLTVSKAENGRQITSESFFKLLLYCSNYISLDFLFAKDFSIVKAENYTKSFSMNSVVKARLEMIRGETNLLLEKARKQVEQQLQEASELL